MRFNVPPQWPVPPGWFPDRSWVPDPTWPPAPPGWRFFDDDAPSHGRPTADIPPPDHRDHHSPNTTSGTTHRTTRFRLVPTVVAVTVTLALATVIGYAYHRMNGPDVVVLEPVDGHGDLQTGWRQDDNRSGDDIDCSFGSPSLYDKTDGVRNCGATADAADACWPAADTAHVLCLVDPFARVVTLIGAQGLDSSRKSLTEDPTPFGLVLDDGTQCRARNGGAWSAPTDHPDWVGFYGCHDGEAVWGPPNEGIAKGFGGWTVHVGPLDGNGHLTTHKITTVFYVGVAPSDAATNDDGSGGAGGGTRLITKCGHPPELRPETIRTDSGALVIRMKIVAHCPSGDVLTSSNTRITVTAAGQNVASGVFDLSAQPIVIAPEAPGNDSEPTVEHDFRFPLGTFWRLPVSLNEVPANGATQQGDVDLDVTTLLVACDQSGSGSPNAPSSAPSTEASVAVGPANPASGDGESSSFDALRAIANADRPFVTTRLTDTWVPQLSSKRPGLVADGKTWNNADTLQEHLQLRLKYPEVRLLWSGDWSTFSAPDFWVTIAGVTFPDPNGALTWCQSHGFDRDHCYAKLVSTTHPIDGSTAFNP